MITMKPDALLILEEELGQQVAAEAIGASPGIFTAARRDGEVRKAYEMAAELMIGKGTQYICDIPKSSEDLFLTFMKGLEIEVVKL